VEVIRVLGKLHNFKLPNYYFSPVITFIILRKSRNMDWARYVVCMKEMRMTFNTSFENPEGKKPFLRPSHINREY
jgi:hypothetical protein